MASGVSLLHLLSPLPVNGGGESSLLALPPSGAGRVSPLKCVAALGYNSLQSYFTVFFF